MSNAFMNGQQKPAKVPHPAPSEPPLPAWRNPENFPGPDLPGEPVRPAILPTDPWEDPEMPAPEPVPKVGWIRSTWGMRAAALSKGR